MPSTLAFPAAHRPQPIAPVERKGSQDDTPAIYKELENVSQPRLTWKLKGSYDGMSRMARLTLDAVNESATQLAFGFVTITFMTMPEGPTSGCRLFNEDRWAPEEALSRGEIGIVTRRGTGTDEVVTRANAQTAERAGTEGRFHCAQGWVSGSEGIRAEVAPNWTTRDLDATIGGLDMSGGDAEGLDSFRVPKGNGFSISMRDRVDRLGSYVVKIHESWMAAPGKVVSHGNTHAVVYKVVELVSDSAGQVTFTAVDLADRIKRSSAA